ncbi:MAG TPA: 3-keto-5-aminohexanoate cleavage protein, partial [Haliscomenobacter sp.]|nr:3-keto-5-aminohexanoate cleavage protein [Haliscomenobacter sp.]
NEQELIQMWINSPAKNKNDQPYYHPLTKEETPFFKTEDELITVNIITGNVAGMQTNLAELGILLAQLPPGAVWALGGIGQQQLAANTLAIATGGGVRIGLEDNLHYDAGRKIQATNTSLLKRIHELASIFERPIMSPSAFGALGFYNNYR